MPPKRRTGGEWDQTWNSKSPAKPNQWYPGRDLNPHLGYPPKDSKSLRHVSILLQWRAPGRHPAIPSPLATCAPSRLVVNFAIFDFDDDLVGALVVGDAVLPDAAGNSDAGGLISLLHPIPVGGKRRRDRSRVCHRVECPEEVRYNPLRSRKIRGGTGKEMKC